MPEGIVSSSTFTVSSSPSYQPSPLSNGMTNTGPSLKDTTDGAAASPTPRIRDHRANNTAPETFFDSLPLPRLIVFDLDYTLWPFWVDTHVTPPVKAKENNTRVQDRWGESFTFYPGVPNVLHAARERGITMGVASRTHTPDLARSMLKDLVVTPPFRSILNDSEDLVAGGHATGEPETAAKKTKGKKASGPTSTKPEKPIRAFDYFTYMQIFPGCKTAHFRLIHEATRKKGAEVRFEDMLFFDDEARNRNVETDLGVTFWLVRDGITKEEIDKGVREWRKKKTGSLSGSVYSSWDG